MYTKTAILTILCCCAILSEADASAQLFKNKDKTISEQAALIARQDSLIRALRDSLAFESAAETAAEDAAAELIEIGEEMQAADSTSADAVERPVRLHVPVRSRIQPSGREAIDSLETTDPRLMLVLYNDHSWAYSKMPSDSAMASVFDEYWSQENLSPYRVESSSLPARTTLLLVDDTEHYCCPNKVPVYSKFGIRHRRSHCGVDLPSPTGTPAYAAFAGKVRYSNYYKGYGNLVIIRHTNGLETYYGHLSRRDVNAGDWVEAGQTIGLIGSTGRSTGPHLHFETRYKGHAFDPEWLIDFNSGNLRDSVFVLKRSNLSVYSKYTPESIDEEEEILKAEDEDRAEAARKAAEEAAKQYYRVKSGDTLGAIARRNGTTVKNICRLNGIKETTILQIGRKLRVR